MVGGEKQGKSIAPRAHDDVDKFAAELLAAMDDLHYFGIDVDWEDDIVTADLVALARQLREDRPNMVLTYPAPVVNLFHPPDMHLAALADSVDRFSIMSYSGTFTGADAHAGYSVAIDDTLQRWAAQACRSSRSPRAKGQADDGDRCVRHLLPELHHRALPVGRHRFDHRWGKQLSARAGVRFGRRPRPAPRCARLG
jgi:hypothetical protein